MSKQPIEVVCPKCNAAVGAKCTESYKGGVGMMFTDRFCIERIIKAQPDDRA